MKKLSPALILKSGILAVGLSFFFSSPAAAVTRDQCEKMGGSWHAGPHGSFGGGCTIAIAPRIVAAPSDVGNFTKELCIKVGGTVSADGKQCLITTFGLKKRPEANSKE